MHKIDVAVPTEYSIVIAETVEELIPCIFSKGKFFRISNLQDNILKNKIPEKVIQWDYTITISKFKEKQKEIKSTEISLLKSLMLKYKEELIEGVE